MFSQCVVCNKACDGDLTSADGQLVFCSDACGDNLAKLNELATKALEDARSYRREIQEIEEREALALQEYHVFARYINSLEK
jgi:hypothetical protein